MSAGFDFFAIARAARDSQDLSSIDKLVLVVGLMMNRNAATGACFPSYPTIKHSCSLKDDRTVALAISHLETAGFLSRKKERGKSTRYEFHVPASEVPALNAPTSNVPAPNVGRVPASDVGGVPASDVGLNNKGNNKVNNKEERPRDFVPEEVENKRSRNSDWFVPQEVRNGSAELVQVFKDWMKIRKAKHTPLTQTAWTRFKKEADKSGLTLVEAMSMCAEKGWISLRATWESVQQEAVAPGHIPTWVANPSSTSTRSSVYPWETK